MKKIETSTDRDFMWSCLHNEASRQIDDRNFSGYRNAQLKMYQFLIQERRYSDAFFHLCIVAAHDLRDMTADIYLKYPSLQDQREILKDTIRHNFPYQDSCAILSPATIGWMNDMQEIMGWSDSKFRTELIERFQKIHVVGKLFTDEEMADIVLNEIGEHPRKLGGIYRQAEARLRKKLADFGTKTIRR